MKRITILAAIIGVMVFSLATQLGVEAGANAPTIVPQEVGIEAREADVLPVLQVVAEARVDIPFAPQAIVLEASEGFYCPTLGVTYFPGLTWSTINRENPDCAPVKKGG